MNILGVTGAIGWDGNVTCKEAGMWVHGSSASLVSDGVYIGSCEEERFTRIKHDGNYPSKAVAAILKKGNLLPEDINIVAYPGSCLPINHILQYRDSYIKNELQKRFPNATIMFIDHHVAHACATFFSSNFESANIFTYDGSGEIHFGPKLCESDEEQEIIGSNNSTFSIGNKTSRGGISILCTGYDMVQPYKKQVNNSTFSLGLFFNSISNLAWILYHKQRNRQPPPVTRETVQGKIMGMSAYGNHTKVLKYIKNPFEILQVTKTHLPIVYTKSDVITSIDSMKKQDIDTIPFTAEDLAAWGQYIFQDTVIHFLKKIPDQYKEENLCIGGGCGLNILTNTQILESKLYKNVHIHPATGDNGLSAGAAFMACSLYEIPIKLPVNLGTVGLSYSNSEIEKALQENTKRLSYIKLNDDNLYKETAILLKTNKIVAWYQGESEYGPRALGNRSILANPSVDNKNLLNSKVKFRESWRPYAAIIMQEHLSKWVDIPTSSSHYMLFSGTIQMDKRSKVPGITHADNSCRIQTVNNQVNERAYNLLQHFYNITSIPLLLNTSFNTIPGEPIVETPQDACKSFLYSDVDVLVMGNYVITKRGPNGSYN